MNQHRIEAYADGIFAIAATLLILNFAVPIVSSGNNTELMYRLIAQWPKALVYLLSFGVITNYWRLHSAIFRNVKVIDHKTTMYNAILLVMVASIPYTTNVAGTYPNLPSAAVLYSFTPLLANLAGKALVNHLIASHAYGGQVPFSATEGGRRLTVIIYVRVAALIFAFFLPLVSYAIYWIIVVYFLLARGIDEYSKRRNK